MLDRFAVDIDESGWDSTFRCCHPYFLIRHLNSTIPIDMGY
ncbi:unnamed protein product [Toxocara canis]|uniref:Uncharacterized protein n=1 Tax=Toxocara canis TaxID=6265 RepID=A0A183VGI4_TOXCA|nr:unnamed protein product [Toxocara canis]